MSRSSPRNGFIIAVLLLASLGGNGLLLWRWRVQIARATASPVPAVEAEEVTAPSPALHELWRRPFPGLRAPRTPPPKLDACALRSSMLSANIAELDQLREQLTPPLQRHGEAAVNVELTAALSGELRRLLPAKLRSEVTADCRGRLCRVQLSRGAQDAPWVAELHRSEWMGEHLHQVARDKDGLLFEEHRPGSMRGSDLLQQALQDFESSGAVDRCLERFQGEGTLDAHLTLEAFEEESADPGIHLEAGGRLAGTPLGKCIHDELHRALAAMTLPPHYQRATLLAQFPRR
ncbi:MAG TPA: hypothetical protein VN914_14540 [Polyangia bacterium]|nr:hypothetical protein [Polyangia bacterium]